jgi:hypothetical protein
MLAVRDKVGSKKKHESLMADFISRIVICQNADLKEIPSSKGHTTTSAHLIWKQDNAEAVIHPHKPAEEQVETEVEHSSQ